MTRELIERWYPLEDVDIKRVDRKGREVVAYVTPFGQPTRISDRHGKYWEEINRSAFNRTLSHGIQRVQVFYNHGYDLSGRPNLLGAVPIATPREVTPDSRGLLSRAYYNDSELSEAILAAWEGGQIKGQSFTGPVFNDRKIGKRGDLDHIERTELGLREFGPTFGPAYEMPDGLVAIRSAEQLETLVRSMIHSLVGTPDASPASATSVTEPGTSSPGDPLTSEHSSRNHRLARQRANRMRAHELGVLPHGANP
jgi:phage head maturation protease